MIVKTKYKISFSTNQLSNFSLYIFSLNSNQDKASFIAHKFKIFDVEGKRP